MRLPQRLLLLLLAVAALQPLGILLGWFAPAWTARHLGVTFEMWMIASLLTCVALVVWAFVHCLRNESLARTEKNRWYGLLVATGPFAAAAYLLNALAVKKLEP